MGKPIVCRIASTWSGETIREPETATVEIGLGVEGARISVRAPFHDDPAPPLPPGPTPGLWNYEVVEVFLLGADGYLEVELGPWGHHLVIRLGAPREVRRSLIPIDFTARRSGGLWTGTADLPRPVLPECPDRFNAYCVHGSGSDRRYLAAFPVPGERPDFHRLDCFGPLASPPAAP